MKGSEAMESVFKLMAIVFLVLAVIAPIVIMAAPTLGKKRDTLAVGISTMCIGIAAFVTIISLTFDSEFIAEYGRNTIKYLAAFDIAFTAFGLALITIYIVAPSQETKRRVMVRRR